MDSANDDSFSNIAISTKSVDKSEHLNRLSDYMRADYNGKKTICDLEIICSDGVEKAHSQVISAFSSRSFKKSPYTVKMLPVEIENEKITISTVKGVLSWIYNGKADYTLKNIHNDLEVIDLLEINELREKIEISLVEMSKGSNAVEVLNAITRNIKFIPHSFTIQIPISDRTLQKIVENLHLEISQGLPYRSILKLTPETVIVIISSKIEDDKKVNVINLALTWIYECRIAENLATKILRSLTFEAMTYEMLVNFRNSLVQTAIPVRQGICVRIQMKENNKLDIVFGKESDLSTTGSELSSKSSTTSSSFVITTPSKKTPSLQNQSFKSWETKERGSGGREVELKPFTDSQFEYINKLAEEQKYEDKYKRIEDLVQREAELIEISEEDCKTAVSFSYSELRQIAQSL